MPSLFLSFRSAVSAFRDRAVVVFLLVAATLGASMLGAGVAQAAALHGFEAMQVQVPTKVTMAPGETKTLTLTFQNLGPNSWSNSGDTYISVYTYGPKYRSSIFKSSSWLTDTQPAKLKETAVKVGKIGTINLSLTAPKTTGSYSETFNLAAEGTAWIPGGTFTIAINVASAPAPAVAPTASSKTSTSTKTTPTIVAPTYQAQMSSVSDASIVAKGGISIVYTFSAKNIGTKAWASEILQPSKVQLADVSASDIQHKSWKSSAVVMEHADAVAPGNSATYSFAFVTPKHKGSYHLSFQLAVAGESVDGGEIDIPVDVTSDAPGVKDSPTNKNHRTSPTTTVDQTSIVENIMLTEPTIRVGVLIVDDETDNKIVITGATDVNVEDTAGNILATVKRGDSVTAYYKDGKYYYQIGAIKKKLASPLRFVPTEANAILTISNFDRKVTRGSAFSNNQFRNVLELRYNDTKDRTWAINELPMEYYLKGLGETSNDSAAEFQKALITAARTYAYYHFQRNTKHDAEGFTVDAYADQVYFGYGQESRTPKLSQAIDATRGITVTYNGDTAITPYFSRSAGTTLDWDKVWGGSVPWCKGVPVPWDNGKTLWGHGVGMSASGALGMAKDGSTFDQILKYFYTGIALEKRWK